VSPTEQFLNSETIHFAKYNEAHKILGGTYNFSRI
jgi:hypothetical protein